MFFHVILNSLKRAENSLEGDREQLPHVLAPNTTDDWKQPHIPLDSKQIGKGDIESDFTHSPRLNRKTLYRKTH